MSDIDPRLIARELQRAFDAAPREQSELDALRLVVFSDQHRGQGDGADDFQVCKRAYHAALGYYLELGYRLFVLGDVEELWECRPGAVLRTYADTLALERAFHEQARYVRFWGNHDDEWREPGQVRRFLGAKYGPIQVHEALRLEVLGAGRSLGTLFFVHGHQGTLDSDRWGGFSRFIVRVFWRNIQRLTRIRVNTPAKDFLLRAEHDRAMCGWAAGQSGVTLVAGHTHRPVFAAQTHVQTVEQQLDAARQSLAGDAANVQLREQVSGLRAELEWVRAREGSGSLTSAKPCYFNTGCCCFDDGDITGLEVNGEELRLVRWPDDEGNARPKVLASASLPEILAACSKP